MRFSALPLALIISTLAACDSGTRQPPPRNDLSETNLPRPLASPTTADNIGQPKPAKIAIADGQGREPRKVPADTLLPLARILDIARRRVPGEIIDVELDDDDDEPPEYELEILTADGRSIDLNIDARSGAILKVEED
jgi:hypothetical protein